MVSFNFLQQRVVENQQRRTQKRMCLFATQGKNITCQKSRKLFKHFATILSHVNDSGVDHLKPCDMIYFPVINFTTKSDEISANGDAFSRPLFY